jgi:hypothetical protein
MGGAQYAVAGSDCTYFVSADPIPVCCCPDATQRNLVCKHLMAAMLVHRVPGALAYAAAHGRGTTPRSGWRLAEPAPSIDAALAEIDTAARAIEAARGTAPAHPIGRGRRGGAARGGDKSTGRLRELSSWVATSPESGLTEWRALAARGPVFEAQAALIRITPAIQDPAVRRSVIRHAATIRIIQRLMPFSAPSEFRFLFRRLVELGHHSEAVSSLEDPANTRRHALTTGDITPLLTSENMDIRTRAFMVLDTIDLTDEADLPAIDELPDVDDTPVQKPKRRSRARKI